MSLTTLLSSQSLLSSVDGETCAAEDQRVKDRGKEEPEPVPSRPVEVSLRKLAPSLSVRRHPPLCTSAVCLLYQQRAPRRSYSMFQTGFGVCDTELFGKSGFSTHGRHKKIRKTVLKSLLSGKLFPEKNYLE